MSEPEQVDLPADTVPPELEGLVALAPDGSLTWTRTTSTPGRGLAAGTVAAGVAASLVGFTSLMLAARIGGEIGAIAGIGMLIVPFVGLFGGLAFRQVSERVRVDREGTHSAGPLRWSDGDRLLLHGNLALSRMSLDRIDAEGRATTVRSWTGMRAHRQRGWDVDSSRWFAERVAEVAGLPLIHGMTGDAAWQARDAQRAEQERIARERAMGKLEDYASTRTPTAPEARWDPAGVDLEIEGRDYFAYCPPAISYHAGVPVRVERGVIRVGRARIPVDDVLDIQPCFELQRYGKGWAEVGEIRAITAQGHIVLARRYIHWTPPEAVLGGAAAVKEAVVWAREAGQDAEPGTADDVPDALRALAARTEEGSR